MPDDQPTCFILLAYSKKGGYLWISLSKSYSGWVGYVGCCFAVEWLDSKRVVNEEKTNNILIFRKAA